MSTLAHANAGGDAVGKPLTGAPVRDLRQFQGEPPELAAVRDLEIQGAEGRLAARLFTPKMRIAPTPLIVFFHGGGWSRGDVTLYDTPCRALADATRSCVLYVDYRLAPNHPFPAPLQDCYSALCDAAANAASWHCDPARLVVAGDSAGGNLAAAVCFMSRDLATPAISHQILIYPALDATLSSSSYEAHATTPFLTTAQMNASFVQYAGEPGRLTDPLVSPLLSHDFSALPSATIVTAEVDPVAGDGDRFARALNASGVEATHLCITGARHMALHMRGVSASGAHIYEHIGARIRALFPEIE